jgi:hypothetical protein
MAVTFSIIRLHRHGTKKTLKALIRNIPIMFLNCDLFGIEAKLKSTVPIGHGMD